MPETRIVGNDGTFTGFGSNNYNLVCNAWSMTASRVVSDVTGYGDTARGKRGGIAEYTGSASGFMSRDAALTAPNIGAAEAGRTGANYLTAASGVSYTLTAATGCTFSGDCVISNVSIASSKTGDATISFDFACDGAPLETWDAS
jgi:hypothetical protein